MDSIFTTMKNFQDVLYQKDEQYGALWCDEGVYCIAKEIQILRPVEFQNIWLGMGPFHWTKILLAATGKFLEHSGITKALYKSKVFLKSAAETNIMKGGDYVQGKDGMGIIAEVMMRLQYEVYLLALTVLLVPTILIALWKHGSLLNHLFHPLRLNQNEGQF